MLTYRPIPAPTEGIIQATLTVSKSEFHSESGTVTLRENGETHEFTFDEALAETLPVDRVPTTVFEPDSVLLDALTSAASISLAPADSVPNARSATRAARSMDRVEPDATYRLFRSRIWVGQNAAVRATPEGVRVSARLPDADRLAALQQSFSELLESGAVMLDAGVDASAGSGVSAFPAEIVRTLPVYPLLETFFAGLGPDHQQDRTIHSFATWILERTARRAEHMQAAQALITRWPAERLRGLDLDSIVSWQSMIQGHAESVRQETELLRTQLSPLFKVGPSIVEMPRAEALSTVEEAADILDRLSTLVARQDNVIRVAFQPCAALPCEIPDSATLFRSFSALEIEASRFSRFYLKLGSASPQ